MKLTLLSKNEFHHVHCMLYRLNNASQSSRWLLVEDFRLWLLLVSVVAWLVRCWLEPGRGQQTAVRGEWPGPICHLVTTGVITGLRALWWPHNRHLHLQRQWSSTDNDHHHHRLTECSHSWVSGVHDLHFTGDKMTRSFHSGPSPSNLSLGCHHCFYPTLLILIKGWLLAIDHLCRVILRSSCGHSGWWHSDSGWIRGQLVTVSWVWPPVRGDTSVQTPDTDHYNRIPWLPHSSSHWWQRIGCLMIWGSCGNPKGMF